MLAMSGGDGGFASPTADEKHSRGAQEAPLPPAMRRGGIKRDPGNLETLPFGENVIQRVCLPLARRPQWTVRGRRRPGSFGAKSSEYGFTTRSP